MRKLRAIANYAKGLNMHGADPEIFDCVEDKMKWHKFEPRTASKRVIQLIENVDRSLLTPKEEFCLDLFLFSYYTGGMVNVDICHLTYNMIQGNQVIYERMKFPKIGKPLLIEKLLRNMKVKALTTMYSPYSQKNIPQRPKCVIESFKSLIESARR